MANRFWVGNSGNTSDIAHWSTTSGGAGGASVPTSADNAKWDSNSFTIAGQTCTVDATFTCLDLDWTGATNNPTFARTAGNISVFGNLILIAAMTYTASSTVILNSTSTGKTITTAGKTLSALTISGVGGGWTLQDDIIVSGNITHSAGAFNTNGKTVTANSYSGSNSNVRSLTLGASTLNLGSWSCSTVVNLTFSSGTSNIILASTFSCGGLIFYNLTSNASSSFTIDGSNTFNILTINNTNKTLNLTAGTTQTILASIIFNGKVATPNTMQSTSAGSAATIIMPASRFFIRHTSIKDITIASATSFTSIGGTNASGNTGITFVTKFEMGRFKNDGSLNWYSAATGSVAKISG